MTKPKLQTAKFAIDTSIGEVAYLYRGDDGATIVELTLAESKVRELVPANPWLDTPDGPGWWWLIEMDSDKDAVEVFREDNVWCYSQHREDWPIDAAIDAKWQRIPSPACPEQKPEGAIDPIPFHDDDIQRCHDCNVALGGFHHPGCDAERCPKCDGQLISCSCVEVLE